MLRPMSDLAMRLGAGAVPVVGVATVPRAGGQPFVVIVVDDADDQELACVLASADEATGYGGSWSAQVSSRELHIRFHLVRRGAAWERQWTCPDPSQDVLDAVTAGAHHVAVLPLVGDLSRFVEEGVGGGLMIEAQASRSVAAARAVLPATTAGDFVSR